jgi:hypothetical protein
VVTPIFRKRSTSIPGTLCGYWRHKEELEDTGGREVSPALAHLSGGADDIMWRFDANRHFPSIVPLTEWRRDNIILWQTPLKLEALCRQSSSRRRSCDSRNRETRKTEQSFVTTAAVMPLYSGKR